METNLTLTNSSTTKFSKVQQNINREDIVPKKGEDMKCTVSRSAGLVHVESKSNMNLITQYPHSTPFCCCAHLYHIKQNKCKCQRLKKTILSIIPLTKLSMLISKYSFYPHILPSRDYGFVCPTSTHSTHNTTWTKNQLEHANKCH